MSRNPTTPSEVDDTDVRHWLSEIEAAKERQREWYKKAEQAIDRYKDEKARPFGSLNILSANVQTQVSALGEDFGKPQVSRINAPEDDDGLTRHISMVWERAIDAAVKDSNDNHEIRLAVHDVLLAGRGTVWQELNPHEDDEGNVTWVEAPLVRVNYLDYLEGPANRWGDVPWVARRHLFTLDDLKQMGVKNSDKVPRNYQLPTSKDDRRSDEEKGKEQFRRAAVWEIWAKFPKKRRIYVAEDYQEVLKVDSDPFRLKKFFPCPRPMLANGDEGWQVPITDYSRYEDQAAELDRVSQRIYVLTEILKNHGVYDKRFADLQNLPYTSDNVFLPIDNFAELMQNGGLPAVMQAVDLTGIIAVLAELHKQRRELIQLIYELTGISDLARGMTDPGETATAQRMKMTFGSGRFQERQKESRRFAAEAYAIKAELIAEHFPREQIAEMCGMDLPLAADAQKARTDLAAMQMIAQRSQQAGQPVPQFDPRQVRHLVKLSQTKFTWEDISGVLHSDYRRCYSVDVETDQTAFRDEEADKGSRIEFFQAFGQVMQQLMPAIQGNPANGEAIKEMAMFVLSAFKAGRSIEESIEQSIDNAIKKAQELAQQPQQQAPVDPVAQAQAQLIQAQAQKAQIDAQTAKQMGAIKIEIAQKDLAIKAAELVLKEREIQTKAIGQDIELKGKMVKAMTTAAPQQAAMGGM